MEWTIRLKRAYSNIQYYSGFLYAKKYLANKRSIILGYHRVLPKQSEELQYIQPGMYVTTETFQMHMEYIAKHYNIITLESLIDDHNIKNACVITFDDGWYDNFEYAFPILKQYAIPATIFLTTNMIGTNKWPWPDRIAYYVYHSNCNQLDTIYNIIKSQPNCDQRILGRTDRSFGRKESHVENIVNHLKIQNEEILNAIMRLIDIHMEELSKALDKHRIWLTWDEVQALSSHNISFGAHTHNHVILTQTSYENMVTEIVASREALRKKLDYPAVKFFSYPNGNYSMDLIRIIQEQGFELAVTTKPGSINKSDSPFELRRILIHNDMTDSKPNFVTRITI